MLPKECNNCNNALSEDRDFYIDRITECPHNIRVKCSYKYECKDCKYESGWNTSKSECEICQIEEMKVLLSHNEFKDGIFKEILYVDKGCLESMPCQHYLVYIDNLGEKQSILMTSNKIYNLFSDCGLPAPVIH